MKKKNLIITLSIIFGIIAFFVLSFMISDLNKVEIKEITVDNWIEEVKQDKYVVTVIGSSTCHFCQEYKPIINKLSKKYEFSLYFFEGDTMKQEDYLKLVNSYEELEHDSVPFTAILKNDKVVASIESGMDEKEAINFLKENGVIK